MRRIYTLTKTIKSNSHNSPYTFELGHHWPAGEHFHLAPSYAQVYFAKVAFDQIGGEEVRVIIHDTMVEELFGIKREKA